MEVCPQFNEATGFVGAATIAQVKLFNDHPTGKFSKKIAYGLWPAMAAYRSVVSRKNCVEVCPKQIPLTSAISDVSRDVLLQKAKDFLRNLAGKIT